MAIETRALTGKDIASFINPLAALRIRVFRDYPYLYDGDMSYEQKYLADYASEPTNLCVVALDGDSVVGASTAMWLRDADPSFQTCFKGEHWQHQSIFYLGESVVLPEYRGQGLGHAFFELREKHARTLGANMTAFCAIDRDENDPARPDHYTDLKPFWNKWGYTHHPELVVYFEWKEIGEHEPSRKPLSFWLKSIME